MLRALFIIVSILMVGCADSSESGSVAPTIEPTATTVQSSVPTTTEAAAPTSDAAPSSTTTVPADVVLPAQLVDFATDLVKLDGVELLVAVADSSQSRQQGLMNVEDIGDLDGMLFVFDSDASSGFWMKNTLIPLDIAFFDVDGEFVDGFSMEPCTTADCPTYRPSGSYRFALEVPAGAMPDNVQVLER